MRGHDEQTTHMFSYLSPRRADVSWPYGTTAKSEIRGESSLTGSGPMPKSNSCC